MAKDFDLKLLKKTKEASEWLKPINFLDTSYEASAIDAVMDIMLKLEKENLKLRDTLEDFILEDDHMPSCEYKTRFGLENDCKCMDRVYYNKDACVIRAKAILEKIDEG